jgi:hypothetical protein
VLDPVLVPVPVSERSDSLEEAMEGEQNSQSK